MQALPGSAASCRRCRGPGSGDGGPATRRPAVLHAPQAHHFPHNGRPSLWQAVRLGAPDILTRLMKACHSESKGRRFSSPCHKWRAASAGRVVGV